VVVIATLSLCALLGAPATPFTLADVLALRWSPWFSRHDVGGR
jgi:hypothetical protein